MNQISLFLYQMKSIVRKNGFILVRRRESLQFLSDFNITIDQLKRAILSLEEESCFDGPEPDRDPRYSEKWTVAEFCPKAFGEKLYLKLSIRIDAESCKCLSVKLYSKKSEALH